MDEFDLLNCMVAQELGWKKHPHDGIWGCWDDPSGITKSTIPNSVGDLNVAHSNEDTLNEQEWADYQLHLLEVVSRRDDFKATICHASAAERAEAFLMTKGVKI